MNAQFSIWSQFYNTVEPEEAIVEFEKDGLKYTEISSEHITSLMRRGEDLEKTGSEFSRFCADHGVCVRQAHLIFPSDIVTDKSASQLIPRELRLLSSMGVRAAVLHADPMQDSGASYSEIIEKNIEALKPIVNECEKYGIYICLENLQSCFRGIDDILYAIDKIGSDILGVCLDTGHLNLSQTSSQREFILKAGSRLKALHIADNDGSRDQHLAPFGAGKVDFIEVVRALSEIGYDGMFNYEVSLGNKYTYEQIIENYNKLFDDYNKSKQEK